MSRNTEEIECPHNPAHGPAVKRWLRGEYRPSSSGGSNMPVADIFEIDCKTCGKFEYRVARTGKLDAGEESVRKLMGK